MPAFRISLNVEIEVTARDEKTAKAIAHYAMLCADNPPPLTAGALEIVRAELGACKPSEREELTT